MEKVKYIVASDIHGSFHYAEILKERFMFENADKMILLGDLYYHGPRNDLPKDYCPMKVCELLNGIKDKLTVIQGNCDSEIDKTISDFEFMSFFETTISGKRFFFSHGDKFNIENYPKNSFDVMFYGHFHKGMIKNENQKIFVNTGSVSIPKDNSTNSYAIITEKEIILKNLNGEIIEKVEF